MNVGPVAVNEWSHLAITYDAGTNTKQFFINGNLASTSNPVAFSPNNGNLPDGFTHEDEDFHIGGGGDSGTSFRFDGRIDDVILYDNVLSQADIQNLATNSIPEPSGSALLGLVALGFLLRRSR